MTPIIAADFVEGEITTRRLIIAAAILIGGLVISMLARRIMRRMLLREGAHERGPVDATAVSLASRLVQIAIAAFVTIYALYVLGVQVGPLFAALGIGGIALAFAMRDTLENLIAGMVLQLRRPFVIGDRVTLGPSDGTIVDVGFRYVQLARPDGTTALIPARRVLDDVVVNHSGAHPRRSDIRTTIPRGVDPRAARAAAHAALQGAPLLHNDPAPTVLLTTTVEGNPTLLVRCWYDPASTAAEAVVDEVLERVLEGLDRLADPKYDGPASVKERTP